uniref:NADH-ubiquinone oxidoreductase chain 4L n=1 Tax=Etrocorema hochii TaxID=2684660 RepID=A0A6B9P9T4_9NEOP|nr:NADH dehydrogenase subunit 4L [Etrocorema hochii]
MLMSYMCNFFLIFFICGGWVFVSKRKHLLLTLLSLEFMVLSIFLGLFIYLVWMSSELYFSMVFLTFSVCEGALGLAILVSMISTHGNDYFQSFSILQC